MKEIKFINNVIVDELYSIYGYSIDAMKNSTRSTNIRGKLASGAKERSKEINRECTIVSEDIVLVPICPYLNIPIVYNNDKLAFNSASLDRFDNSKGYTKDNIQVVSHLANCMKSYATNEQLTEFSKNVLRLHIN